MTNPDGELVQFDFGGAYRYNALAASLVPTASGDGRIIVRLLIRTDDPHARHMVITLEPQALATIAANCVALLHNTQTGEMQRIAQRLDIATQIDNLDEGGALGTHDIVRTRTSYARCIVRKYVLTQDASRVTASRFSLFNEEG